jgi:leucyl-tRNA synthetase
MSELNFKEITKKWQKKWSENKIFESEPNEKPKFFANAPYPYVNAYPHIGHLYTYMRAEAFARYKRLKGFNVLFPQGWHATGSPIVNAAGRVKSKEPKQIKIMKDMGFSEEEIKKFEEPKYWIEFFIPEFEKDFKSMGMSIDWRRSFYTTSMNPHYDKFIRWQFRKLKEKNLVIKGKFPVVWDPVQNCAVGDHDRTEGEGEVPQEFCLFKFELSDGRKLVSATLRPDTVFGITNVYVNPKETYKEVKVGSEKWIVASPCIERLKMQDFDVEELKEVKGTELIGEKVSFLENQTVSVLPANFISSDYGTGIVHSVPSDSADDLIALRNLQEDDKLLEKYSLDKEEIKAIKPIAIFKTPEVGDLPADFFLKKYGVKSQDQRDKLEKIKKELYKLTFNKSTFNDKYKELFSKDLSGMLVKDGQEIIKKDLLEKNKINLFYQLTAKVVSRGLNECVVKIVDDQWFVNYSDEEWKKKTHKCLDNMNLYPQKARAQFDYVIDWLHQWACTREEGLGTRLPWDEDWLIESLSDSTIYMAYYTFVHILEKLPLEKINDELFDYILLGKGRGPFKEAEEMRKSFDYYYPFDFRNSGKDLIQNHLTFCMFNHTAIFSEDKWPKGFGTNGWVRVDGQKMSKSLGNMIPVRKMADEFGPDASRITILNGGEELDDPNWDSSFAKNVISKLNQIYEFAVNNYSKHSREEIRKIDRWFESELNKIIKEATDAMEKTLFRSSIQKVFFDMQRILKHYTKRTKEDYNKELIDKFIESQIVMLSVFTPHICEEAWEKIGKQGFVSLADWPEFDEKKIDESLSYSEEFAGQIITDIRTVQELAKLEKISKVNIFVSEEWKYDLFDVVKKEFENENRDFKVILGKVMADENLRKQGKVITKILPSLLKKGMPAYLSQKEELAVLEENLSFLKREFDAQINVFKAEDSNENKAKQALPSKPAILVE